MKIEREEFENIGSRTLKVSNIEIGDHSFILEMVMKDQYSNPIEAICRELASNCRDAHREIGTPDRPIEIKLPNHWNNDIVFKDYGPGISPSRIDDVYTKVGRSTKRDSNLQTGGFGLGAKTPFAYTSQFSVITTTKILNQVDVDTLNLATNKEYKLASVLGKHLKCTYTMFLGSKNENIAGGAKLHIAELTTDPTGTEVIIGVDSKDINSFVQGVIHSTKFWKILPSIPKFSYPEDKRTVIVSGDNWKILSNNQYNYNNYNNGSNIIVDGIPYPINFSVISNAHKDVSNICSYLSRNCTQIFVNTGDIELNPNREQVNYNAKTTGFIRDIFVKISETITKNIISEISKADSYKDAHFKYVTFNNNVFQLTGQIYWNKCRVYTFDFEIPKDDSDKEFACYSYSLGQKRRRLHKINCQETKLYYSTEKNISGDLTDSILANRKLNNFTIISVPNDSDRTLDILKDKLNKAYDIDCDQIWEFIDIETFRDPSVPVTKKTRSSPVRGFSPAYHIGSSNHSLVKIDRDNGSGFYVVSSGLRASFKICEHKLVHWNLIPLFNAYKQITGKDGYLYLVDELTSKKLNKKFLSFEEELNSIRLNLDKELDSLKYLSSSKVTQSIPEEFRGISKEIDEIINTYELVQLDNIRYGHIKILKDFFGDSLKANFQDINVVIRGKINLIEEKYPMIKYVYEHAHEESCVENLRKYIETIDMT